MNPAVQNAEQSLRTASERPCYVYLLIEFMSHRKVSTTWKAKLGIQLIEALSLASSSKALFELMAGQETSS